MLDGFSQRSDLNSIGILWQNLKISVHSLCLILRSLNYFAKMNQQTFQSRCAELVETYKKLAAVNAEKIKQTVTNSQSHIQIIANPLSQQSVSLHISCSQPLKVIWSTLSASHLGYSISCRFLLYIHHCLWSLDHKDGNQRLGFLIISVGVVFNTSIEDRLIPGLLLALVSPLKNGTSFFRWVIWHSRTSG